MHNPTYLMLSRHNIYYFRWPLTTHNKRTEHIRISLGTREPKEALSLAKILEYHLILINKKYGAALADNGEAKELLRAYCHMVLDKQQPSISVIPEISLPAITDLSDRQESFNLSPALLEIKKTKAEIHRLDEVIDKFIEMSKNERDWTYNTRREIIAYLDILKEILGSDFNIAELDAKRTR